MASFERHDVFDVYVLVEFVFQFEDALANPVAPGNGDIDFSDSELRSELLGSSVPAHEESVKREAGGAAGFITLGVEPGIFEKIYEAAATIRVREGTCGHTDDQFCVAHCAFFIPLFGALQYLPEHHVSFGCFHGDFTAAKAGGVFDVFDAGVVYIVAHL